MCLPIIMAAVAIAGSVASQVGASKAANAQNRFSAMVSQLNGDLARETAIDDYVTLGKRITEQEEATAADIEASHKDTTELLGYMTASAGEAGVAGNSLKDLASRVKQDELDVASQSTRQLEFARYAGIYEGRGVQRQYQGRMINGLFIKQPTPGLLSILLNPSTAAAGVSGYAAGMGGGGGGGGGGDNSPPANQSTINHWGGYNYAGTRR